MNALPNHEVLDEMDQRILGALMEKQRTVPASYPMTLNGLRTACNQQNSREPVTAYDEREMEVRLRELKDRGLVRIVWASKGARTLKYHQLLEELLELDEAAYALVAVLLLRGAQSAGELKTRTERLHGFTDRAAVEETLLDLAQRELVCELPVRAGQHDARWIQMLGPVAGAAEEPSASGVDREAVLADGVEVRDQRVRAAYDAVADSYAAQYGAELAAKEFDRWLLDRVALIAAGRPAADVGTGPGQVATYLAEQGLAATGFDASPQMVEAARSTVGEAEFEVGDFRSLMRPPTAAGWGAITAWYALCHSSAAELTDIVAGLARVLDTGGVLAVALHAGDAVWHSDEWFGHEVELDFVLHDPGQVLAAVVKAGLGQVEWYRRGALPGEVDTDRLYVLARKP